MRILTVIINHHFNFCVSKSLYYSTDDALLQNAFTDILNCCDIHFTYILLYNQLYFGTLVLASYCYCVDNV